MQIGVGWRDITPDRPLYLRGQMRERLGQYKRDPLTTNAIVFDDGAQRVAMVSVDLCLLEGDIVPELKSRCAQATDIAAENVIVAATHTHVGPATQSWMFAPADDDWLEQLKHLTAEAVRDAVDDLAEAQLFADRGYLDQMGWNRRGLRRDGSAQMYHGSWKPGHVGIEGPRDGEVGVVWAGDAEGHVRAVLCSFATHPNCLEQGEFYSADIPGEVRNVLRGALGEHVGVVYMTGAAGDTAPTIMRDNVENHQPWRSEAGVKRSGRYLGGEILKTIARQLTPMEAPALDLQSETLSIPVRDWDPWFDHAAEYDTSKGMGWFFQDSYVNWSQIQQESPVSVPVHVLRLGDAAICTNPGELYCAFGHAIKARSPARVTLISELTDDAVGYIPTPQAIRHGGYSAASARTCKLERDAGWQIVDATEQLLTQAFERAPQAVADG